MIDRNYLDSIGWRGIRQRKLHLEELLRKAIADVRAAGQPVRIVDIAAGHGRYVLDAIDRAGALPDSILLRDYSGLNVEQGSALIQARGLEHVAQFVERRRVRSREPCGDRAAAHDRHRLGSLRALPRQRAWCATRSPGSPTRFAAGGLLLYTGQPWHPQLELIARALTSHRGGRRG